MFQSLWMSHELNTPWKVGMQLQSCDHGDADDDDGQWNLPFLHTRSSSSSSSLPRTHLTQFSIPIHSTHNFSHLFQWAKLSSSFLTLFCIHFHVPNSHKLSRPDSSLPDLTFRQCKLNLSVSTRFSRQMSRFVSCFSSPQRYGLVARLILLRSYCYCWCGQGVC